MSSSSIPSLHQHSMLTPGLDLTAFQSPIAAEIMRLSRERWGERKETIVVGQDERLTAALERATKVAQSDSPVLITGETGTGKELFARAVYLASRRRNRPFLAVNCAQYQDGQMIASALFGHRRGSFTGAVADQRGVFEEGDGGVVFLDEVGELSPPAQAMLLRVLGEGDIVPVGATQAKHVDVRVVAATSRDLKPMVDSGAFRADLYYRLRFLHLHVPPVRERGDDWKLLVDYYLARVSDQEKAHKIFSPEATRAMRTYPWPGNVREVRSVVDMAYHMADGQVIHWSNMGFVENLETQARDEQLRRISLAAELTPAFGTPALGGLPFGATPTDVITPAGCLARMLNERASFWDAVHHPFMDRELSRTDVRDIIAKGLGYSRGSYKRLLDVFNMPADDYFKFMDFLRHQRLKPDR